MPARADLKQKIIGWCEARGSVQASEGTDANPFLVLQPNVAPQVSVEIGRVAGDNRVRLSHSFAVPRGVFEWGDDSLAGFTPPSFTETLERLIEARPASVTASTTADDQHHRVTIETFLYDDGAAEHTFSAALDELVRTRQVVDRLHADMSRQRGQLSEIEALATPEPSAASTPAAVAPLTPEAPPVPVAVPQAWVPTHSAPPEGLAAWAEPDASAPPIARLAGFVELQVVETRGAWARVTGSNGWSGWVDNRLLQFRR